jgi:hypothetical protein
MVHDEGSTVDINDPNEDKAEVCKTLRGFWEADIYNKNENALFIDLMRSQGLSNSRTVEKGFRQNKNRIVFLITANMNGTDLALSFVGKSVRPRC